MLIYKLNMADQINATVKDEGGNEQHFRLSQKLNNGNGKTLYAFLNEATSESITICKNGKQWIAVDDNNSPTVVYKNLGASPYPF